VIASVRLYALEDKGILEGGLLIPFEASGWAAVAGTHVNIKHEIVTVCFQPPQS
jgi:hypothetical protein